MVGMRSESGSAASTSDWRRAHPSHACQGSSNTAF